jgi:MoaA/NifB/PqqE/SkfB family radical SAM enzyme
MRLENDKVVDHIGTVLAEKIRGEWHTKDDAVMQFILTLEGGDPILEGEDELEMVRARNDKGHYIADDPNTEVNEAWIVKTVKKAAKKK